MGIIKTFRAEQSPALAQANGRAESDVQERESTPPEHMKEASVASGLIRWSVWLALPAGAAAATACAAVGGKICVSSSVSSGGVASASRMVCPGSISPVTKVASGAACLHNARSVTLLRNCPMVVHTPKLANTAYPFRLHWRKRIR